MAQFEFLRNGLIPTHIGILEVIQQPTPLANHHQKTTAGAMVFLVLLQMFRQVINPLREQRDLHIGRTGITVMQLKSLNRLRLRFHSSISIVINSVH